MKFFLTGVNTVNKGAELMYHAILQEIERRDPTAEVIVPYSTYGLIPSNVRLRYAPGYWINKYPLMRGLRKLGLLPRKYKGDYAIPEVDYYFDASGFKFSDQFNHSAYTVSRMKSLLGAYQKQGTKIVFLPQAFGPFEKEISRELARTIAAHSALVMPREQISADYLEQVVGKRPNIRIFTDFTALVDGIFPARYSHLKSGVCIIPNSRMISQGVSSMDDYLGFLGWMVSLMKDSGHPVYLLNHEGKEDEDIARRCREAVGGQVEVVSGLNGLEVKGMIASSYLCISSRFHGVASALSSCVPCLATSWSHKYEALFADYHISDAILPIDDKERMAEKIRQLLTPEQNRRMRTKLSGQVSAIKEENREMWNAVWALD